ncbi:cytochrome o ubiquinol oxidase subunit II [Edwardsiella ictaluri]|uniref:cytochrome o ubiquinol oxidase subunit II n=1 Tax=Edwardsiella ictaluri TaxID=67780 RepID=UPI0037830CD8
MRLKKYNRRIGMLSLVAASGLLSGCNMVLMDPKGAIGVEQRTLILTAIALMLIVVIPVIFMTFIFAWKYRASNKDAKYMPNWAHSNKIEVVVWTIPIIIIVILGTITWKTTHELDPFKPIVADKKPMTIEVISLDWKWLFLYPEQGIATVNELAFPQDVSVDSKVTSNSVMNAFFIPQLGGQIYAMAGMQTKLHLISNQAGAYKGISSSYSGAGLSGMKFTAIVTPTEGDFTQWVAKVKTSPNNLNTIDKFNKLAEPSKNNPVEYFAAFKPNLFQDTIAKFMGDMTMHNGAGAHKGMDMNQGMDMSEHTGHVGSEE